MGVLLEGEVPSSTSTFGLRWDCGICRREHPCSDRTRCLLIPRYDGEGDWLVKLGEGRLEDKIGNGRKVYSGDVTGPSRKECASRMTARNVVRAENAYGCSTDRISIYTR